MKRHLLLLIILFSLILSAQAQRRYNHFKRIKVERANVIESQVSINSFVKMEVPNHIPNISENIQQHKEEIIVNPINPENAEGGISSSTQQKKLKEAKNIPTISFTPIFKIHKKLVDVKSVKKTYLRTWKWLVIASSILIAIGIVLLILVSNLPHPAASFALAFGIGCVVVGVLLLLIFLILGLTGRI